MKSIYLAFLTVVATSCFGASAFADIKWDLDGGVTTGYDSNITYVENKPVSDMVTYTSLKGGLTQTGKNDQLYINGGLTENIYSDNPTFDNLAENLYTKYTDDLGPYEHVSAQDTFSHSVDPYSLENAFGRINGDYGTYYNDLKLGSTTDITEQWKASVNYNETDFIFSTKSVSNSDLYNPELSTEYDFSSQSQATINYDYRKRVFSPGASADLNTPSAGWRQYITTQWYVDLLAGADFIKGFGESITEPRYGAGLTHDLDQNTELTLKYDKQYETDSFTQAFDNDWHVTLGGFHQFTAKISGNIELYTGQGKYLVSDITEKFIGTNTSLKYELNKHMDFTLTYSLQDSTSNSSIRAYIRNAVFAGIKYTF